MINYDFRNLLSSFEFECFSRDLINAHEGLDLMSFAEGRDGGIDLRYTNDKGKSVIVQAKRYKTYSELKGELKKEVEKVKQLKPQRYILTTSVDLTDGNKSEIIELLKPYIKRKEDILAKQDLNKYLAQHPDIEQRYYKLWLASTDVLVGLLKKRIVNWSNFEKEDIQETVRTYVMNDSFGDAMKKLIENRYVVISGEPGIGKSTLARILIMYLLSGKYIDPQISSSYEEFYFTNSNIEDLADTLHDGKKQIFFYDDFLGQIALEEEGKNFDGRIVKFIRACQRQKDKLFILTTREYILQQGLARYARFSEGKGIEMSKCVVDMGKYTRYVRAQILYNHLEASDIPQDYINDILKEKRYLKLIDHPHYSPRIIETFVSKGVHEMCKPNEYFKKIEGYFEHPDSVWKEALGRLNAIEREALLVLYSMRPVVMFDDWRTAYEHFFNNVHKEANYLDDQQWKEAVRVLQNNFIRINNGKFGMFVDFHNPGVRDVLSRYVIENDKVKTLLLENSYFIEQVFGVFGDDRNVFRHPNVPKNYYDRLCNAFDNCWAEFRSCSVRTYNNDKQEVFHRNVAQTRVDVLSWLVYDYEEMLKTMPGYVEKKMTQDIMTDIQEGLSSQLNLLEKVDLSLTPLDMDEIFEDYINRIASSDDCLNFATSIEIVFPEKKDYLESEEFRDLTTGMLDKDFGEKSESDLEELDSTAEELCKYIPDLEDEAVVANIKKANDDYYESVDAMADRYADEYDYGDYYPPAEKAWEIDNLFATLKQK